MKSSGALPLVASPCWVSQLPQAEGGQGGVSQGFWEGATLGLSDFISAAPTPNTTH